MKATELAKGKSNWQYSWVFRCQCGNEFTFGMPGDTHRKYAAALIDHDYHISYFRCGVCDARFERRIALSIYGVCTMGIFHHPHDLMQVPEVDLQYPVEFMKPPETEYKG